MPTFPHPLKPCLVLGTGFHQWVLGESMRQDFKALHSWPTLLLQVAKALGVALDSRQDHLSLLWEQLLTTAVHDGLKPDGQPTLAPNAHPPPSPPLRHRTPRVQRLDRRLGTGAGVGWGLR